MTSFERYFKAFVRVMPKRMKIIDKLVKEKQKLDEQIIAGDTSKETLSKWEYIVGKDAPFTHRSAEKREKQSLRHYIFKTIRGLEALSESDVMMLEIQDPEFKILIKSNPRLWGVYLELLKLYSERTLYVESLKKLDESLIRQINNPKDSKVFGAEYEVQKKIRDSVKGLPNDIAVLQRNLRGVFERTRKNIDKGELIIVAFGVVVLTVYLQIILEFKLSDDPTPTATQILIEEGMTLLQGFIISTLYLGPGYLSSKALSALVKTIRKSI